MKKNYFYLAAATLLLAGCAQDSFVDENLQETTVPQEIKMSAGNRGISVESRGAGSVDEWADDTRINIYAFNKNIENFESKDDENVYLDNVPAKVSSANAVQLLNESGTPITKYYPLQGAFRFVGYHIDDAVLGELVKSATELKIPVTIDGSQDVMIAKAELTKDDKSLLLNKMQQLGVFNNNDDPYAFVDENNNPLEGEENIYATTIINEYEKAYSSYTARRSVHPQMVFNHQLVRLNFFVKAGDPETVAQFRKDNEGKDTEDKLGVYINSIQVNSHNAGQIIINNLGDISFKDITKTDDEDKIQLSVPQLIETGNNASDYDSTDENTKKKGTKVGEGILVMPPFKSYTDEIDNLEYFYYDVNIGTIQYFDQNGTKMSEPLTNSYNNVKIKKPQLNGQTVPFEVGKSYDVTITVYSNQVINITATLTGWIEGGNIEISPEDEYFQ